MVCLGGKKETWTFSLTNMPRTDVSAWLQHAAACPDTLNRFKCTPEYLRSDSPNNPQYSQSKKGGACLCAELLPMGDDHKRQSAKKTYTHYVVKLLKQLQL